MGLGDRLNHKPSELSGGEQQRVSIARALANRPAIILADEPTGEVDSKTRDLIIGILRRLSDGGQTVIIVTHDPLGGRADGPGDYAGGGGGGKVVMLANWIPGIPCWKNRALWLMPVIILIST